MRKVPKTPRIAVAATVAALLALSLAAVALGDIVGVDVDNVTASEQGNGSTVVLAPGASRTGTYWIVQSNTVPSGDRNGCNVGGADPATLVVDQGTSTKLTLGTPSGQFITCDDPNTMDANEGTLVTATYTVNADACDGETGDVNVPVSYTATGGKPATGMNPASQFTIGAFTVQINCSVQPPPPAVCEDPAAPAIIAAHLKNHGLTSKQPTFKQAITLAASRTGQGKLYGNDPCADGYEQMVLDGHHVAFPSA